MSARSAPVVLPLALINIVLVVHAAKTGRFSPWGYIILMMPGIGAIAYVAVELIPAWFGSRQGQNARKSVGRALDPDKQHRALKDEIERADTIVNREALAEEFCKRPFRRSRATLRCETDRACAALRA
jgi:hypothetical protein